MRLPGRQQLCVLWLFIVGCVSLGGQIGDIASQSGVLTIMNQALESKKSIGRTFRQSIAETSRMEVDSDRSSQGASGEGCTKGVT